MVAKKEEGGSLMRTLMSVGTALALAMVATSCAAKDEQPGCDLKVGDGVGAFQVIKAGGADDGVEVGKGLCYL